MIPDDPFHMDKPGKCLVWSMIAWAFITMVVLVIVICYRPQYEEIASRDEAPNTYQTVHVHRFERTVCYECHSTPKGAF